MTERTRLKWAAAMVLTVLVVAGIVAIVLAYPWFAVSVIGLREECEAGAFGDQFGAVNALFSGLAFAGVIIAIALQLQELRYQRRDLSLTRTVLEQQEAELSRQAKVMQRQSFEDSFFHLLDLFRQSRDDLVWEKREIRIEDGEVRVKRRDSRLTGSQAINQTYVDFTRYFRRVNEVRPETSLADIVDTFFDNHMSAVYAQYFRILYHAFKYLSEFSDFEIDPATKYRYARIARAHLSNAEVLLLSYNCIGTVGGRKFAALYREFRLGDNLPKDHLIVRSHVDSLLDH